MTKSIILSLNTKQSSEQNLSAMYKEFSLCLYLVILVSKFQEGVVSHVTISPDEKTIALATTRDIVCLVPLKSTPRLTAVSTEHIYKQITCLCWNKNSTEVYIGDAVGRISVVVLSTFTVSLWHIQSKMYLHRSINI